MSAVGTYQLTAYTFGAGDLPLPYVQEGTTPGDSDKWYGSTLTLRSDSTWMNVWHVAHCPSGVCGATRSDTLHGTFAHYPPGDGMGAIMLLMTTSPFTTAQGAAVVRGERLELYGMWIYQR